MLDGFFVIDSWKIQGTDLAIRLVPDHFEEAQLEPVITIFVNELQDVSQCESALDQRKSELIVDLEVSEGLAAIYAEYDDEPVSLRGRSVSVTRGPYSTEDLRFIVDQKEQEIDHCYAQLRGYRSRIEGVEKVCVRVAS